MLKWLWLSALVIVLDQITKLMVSDTLQLFESIEVLPFLDIALMHNTGAAFSFLSSASGWQRWFFVILALGVSTAIVIWLRRLPPAERWLGIALSLVLGGAVGNVIDRVIYGYVIDFIDVYYQASSCLPLFSSVKIDNVLSCHWPAFNIADSAISIGAVMLLVDALRSSRRSGDA